MAITDIQFGQQTITMPTDVKRRLINTTSSGNALDGQLGGAFGTIPGGLSWLTDTLHGFDIYERGFVRRPTLFFDPSATSSMNRGTFAHPYNTQAALQAAITGDMRGHVLGIKRGTTLQVTGTNGLTLAAIYGSSADPFTICPYGDSEALPIITAHVDVTDWTVEDAGANIWKKSYATEVDAWQSGERLWKKAWNTNAVTTLTADGRATYNAGVLYIRPFNGENPNLGQFKVQNCEYSILLTYADVAATGYVEVAGLDLRYARKSVFEISAAAKTTISTIDGIVVAGCKIGRGGVDTTTSTPTSDALVIYGASDTQRITTLNIVGNEMYDVCNNAVELSGTNGTARLGNVVVEHNYSHEIGGYSVVELWSSNSGVLVRYNLGEGNLDGNRVATTTLGGGGVWFSNKYETGGNWDNNDATNAKNDGNVAVFNLVKNPYTRSVLLSGGTNHKIQHNTFYSDPSVTHPGTTSAPQGVYTDGTAATGFCNISNNIFYWSKAADQTFHAATMMRINVNPLGAAASVPSGNKNVYFAEWATGNGGWYYSGAQTGSFTTYKTALSAYSLDQNSLASNNFTGGTLTSALLGLSETTFIPLAANIAGATTLTGIGKRYKDGQPYVAASCNAGALLGT